MHKKSKERTERKHETEPRHRLRENSALGNSSEEMSWGPRESKAGLVVSMQAETDTTTILDSRAGVIIRASTKEYQRNYYEIQEFGGKSRISITGFPRCD